MVNSLSEIEGMGASVERQRNRERERERVRMEFTLFESFWMYRTYLKCVNRMTYDLLRFKTNMTSTNSLNEFELSILLNLFKDFCCRRSKLVLTENTYRWGSITVQLVSS